MPANAPVKYNPQPTITAYMIIPHIIPLISPLRRLNLPWIYAPVYAPTASEAPAKTPASPISFSTKNIRQENSAATANVQHDPVITAIAMLISPFDHIQRSLLRIETTPKALLVIILGKTHIKNKKRRFRNAAKTSYLLI